MATLSINKNFFEKPEPKQNPCAVGSSLNGNF